MCRCGAITFGINTPLVLTVILIFLAEAPRRTSSVGVHDKASLQPLTTWCEERDVCAGCQAAERLRSRPRCLQGDGEPLLGADLCGCCYSCVAERGLGQSCGSQLSVWLDDFAQLTTIILATTRCEEGLTCTNFTCSVGLSTVLGHDVAALRLDKIPDDGTSWIQDGRYGQDQGQGEDHKDDLDYPETSITTPSTVASDDPTDGKDQTAMMDAILTMKRTQACWSRSDESTVSLPSNNSIGRVAAISINDKRFQLVYTGNLLSELEVLLNVVDRWDPDSLVDEETVTLLMKASVASEASFREVWKTTREKRDSPENIQQILVRGASAHREYAEEDRIRTVNTSAAETSSQGDESTVNVQIFSGPQTVQTSVDLEGVDESGYDALADQDDAKEAGKASSTSKEAPLGGSKIGFRSYESDRPVDDRLSIMEFRMGMFERTLEDLARLCNIESYSTIRNCFNTEEPGSRFGPWSSSDKQPQRRLGTDERLALASEIEPVKLRGSRQRLGGDAAMMREIPAPGQSGRRNFLGNIFRDDDSSPIRRSGAESRHPLVRTLSPFSAGRRPASRRLTEPLTESPCKKSVPNNRNLANRGPLLSESDSAPRRIVRRSVSTPKPSLWRGYSQGSGILETQIPRPKPPAVVTENSENRESVVREEMLPQLMPSWRMFVTGRDHHAEGIPALPSPPDFGRRHVKRELPLILFGSNGTRSKRILWPSKWMDYHRGRLQLKSQGLTDPESEFLRPQKLTNITERHDSLQ